MKKHEEAKQLFVVVSGAVMAFAVLGPGAALAAESSVGQHGGAGGQVDRDVAAGAGSDPGLAFTGLDVTTLLAIAAALVAAGLILNRLTAHSRHLA